MSSKMAAAMLQWSSNGLYITDRMNLKRHLRCVPNPIGPPRTPPHKSVLRCDCLNDDDMRPISRTANVKMASKMATKSDIMPRRSSHEGNLIL